MRKVGVPGATPQIFLWGMCDIRTQKLTHRPGQILLKKHVNLEKGQKFYLFLLGFLFSPVKIWSTLFFEVSISFSTKSRPLSNSRPPGNFQKSNPDPPGKLFELIPGGCPWDVPSWNWLRHKCSAHIVITNSTFSGQIMHQIRQFKSWIF